MTQFGSLPTVAVHGIAERSVAPDSYNLVARVAVEAAQTQVAAEGLAEGFAALEATIAQLAHLNLDVERTGISMYEDAKPLGSRRSAWHASRAMTLTGRDTSQVAEVAGALGRVPDVAIEGPHWRVERDNPAHAEIQAEAVREALARAERYAAALGGTLGRLVELSDTGMGGGGYRLAMAASARDIGGRPGLESMDFTPQPIEISAGVQGRWYLNLTD
jgi:uncharacterized protein